VIALEGLPLLEISAPVYNFVVPIIQVTRARHIQTNMAIKWPFCCKKKLNRCFVYAIVNSGKGSEIIHKKLRRQLNTTPHINEGKGPEEVN
jgi:hypothetical protein